MDKLSKGILGASVVLAATNIFMDIQKRIKGTERQNRLLKTAKRIAHYHRLGKDPETISIIYNQLEPMPLEYVTYKKQKAFEDIAKLNLRLQNKTPSY